MRVVPLLRIGLCIALLSGPAAWPMSSPAARPVTTGIADTTAAAHAPADSTVTEASPPYSGDTLDVLFEAIVIIVLMLLVVAALAGGIVGFAAVSIFMDSGCLRVIVFCIGWHLAFLGGLAAGLVMGVGELGVALGLLGYPFGWAWGRQRVKQLPREAYTTWKRTLTSSALLGAGAGSLLNLARSATVLFKSGGGSFGGGGASGSFGGLQAGSTGLAALGTGDGAEQEATRPHGSTERLLLAAAWGRRQLRGALRWMRHLRWYHVCAFVLVVLLFVPVGLGAAAWLQDPKTFIMVAALFAAVAFLRWWERRADASATTPRAPNGNQTAFRGGAASDTW